jgi:hypothetical protein
MINFRELQRDLHLVSVALRSKGALELVVRYVVANSGNAGGAVYTPSDTYALIFKSYFAFYTRQEEFFPPDPYDISEGQGFRQFSQSRLLDFVRATAFSENFATRMSHQLNHFGVYCQEELVDVVAVQGPSLTYLGSTNGGKLE